MENDLPKAIEILSDSLSRESRSLAVGRQLQLALKQANSTLSFIRQDAYVQIAQILESHLTDLSTAGPLLELLLSATCWSVMLHSLQNALRSVALGEQKSSSAHCTAEYELIALLGVVQVSCMAHPYAKQSLCDEGLLRLLLECLSTTQPVLACACLDTLMSVQLNYAPGFVEIVKLGGAQQISALIMSPTAPEKVRSWAARFLNLTLTHLFPALLERERVVAGNIIADVENCFTSARHGVEEMLGRDAAALLMRKVDLQDHQAESKLEQLGQALSFFLQQ